VRARAARMRADGDRLGAIELLIAEGLI